MKSHGFVFLFLLGILIAANITLITSQVAQAQSCNPFGAPCPPPKSNKPTLPPPSATPTFTPTPTSTSTPTPTVISTYDLILTWAAETQMAVTPTRTPFSPPVAGPTFVAPGVAVMLISLLIGLLLIGGLFMLLRGFKPPNPNKPSSPNQQQ